MVVFILPTCSVIWSPFPLEPKSRKKHQWNYNEFCLKAEENTDEETEEYLRIMALAEEGADSRSMSILLIRACNDRMVLS